jgi:hypothetical protein
MKVSSQWQAGQRRRCGRRAFRLGRVGVPAAAFNSLKGWNNKAQGNALGTNRVNALSPERAKQPSIPNIALIEGYLMTSKQRPQLVLKSHLPVVFFLVGDIAFHAFRIGIAH